MHYIESACTWIENLNWARDRKFLVIKFNHTKLHNKLDCNIALTAAVKHHLPTTEQCPAHYFPCEWLQTRKNSLCCFLEGYICACVCIYININKYIYKYIYWLDSVRILELFYQIVAEFWQLEHPPPKWRLGLFWRY